MNINASIIDQQLTGLLETYSTVFATEFGQDDNKKRSAAFVVLCMANCLDISIEDSFELLTEGGNDAGVDGIHIGDVEDGEFLVTIFQGKYKIKDLSGEANFPANGVEKAVNTVQVLFDPSRQLTLNPKIAPKIEEIRSLIRDAYIPQVRVVLCNNGAKWKSEAEHWIENSKKDFPEKVDFEHFNHDAIVSILQKTKKVDTTLALNGKVIVEDMNYMRVLVGRVSVQAIASLFETHGDGLLQRNIRRFLGLNNNRVNTAIHNTLCSNKADSFYFYNNGITVVCDKFDYNAFQRDDYQINMKNMQIINGGQTCKTIHETLKSATPDASAQAAYVMIRIYQLSDAKKDFVQDITYATNSQNPVDLRDLRSNDEMQQTLEVGIKNLGYTYKRQREGNVTGPQVITSLTAAEAVLAIWRKKPHQAKFRRKEHFGKLYEEIFNDLNAAQAIIATLIYRAVENERKRPTTTTPPAFLPYASHYIAMLIGKKVLADNQITLTELTHRKYPEVKAFIETNITELQAVAIDQISTALEKCYGDREVSLQQLSATFRRGDLLEMLG